MTILRKTLFAGLAAVTMISAGAVVAPSQAEASPSYGGYVAQPIHGYNYGYQNYYTPKCFWKKVWKKTHRWHYHKHKVSIKVCY